MPEEEVPQEGGGGGGSFITRRIGPLPAWAWGLVAFTAFFVISSMRKKNTAQQAAQTQANSQGLQSESANAAADNLAQESWPMPANYGNGSVYTPPTAPSPPAYPGSPMIPNYPAPANTLNSASVPAPSPATAMGSS